MKKLHYNASGRYIPFLGVVRLMFIVLIGLITHNTARIINPNIIPNDLIYFDFFAMLVAGVLVLIESQIQSDFPQELLIGVFGLILGLITAGLIMSSLPDFLFYTAKTKDLAQIFIHLFLGYFGITVALRNAHKFDFSASSFLIRSEDRLYGCKILDTSVLIDGRITEIAEAGFLEGLVVIPSFVVNELQILSDSKDPIRRSKGRRGLDISKRLQKMARCEVEILEEDFPNLPEVDKKLLALAKRYEGILLTVDFNLNKVAEIEQISVLNVNLLAQSLKTIVLPGEVIHVQIIREGKESGQGVGYLDDGTMVIVENGRKMLGQEVNVSVASVLQTSAGRLIFTKTAELEYKNDDYKNRTNEQKESV
jgi:uncharacterized protein YacL